MLVFNSIRINARQTVIASKVTEFEFTRIAFETNAYPIYASDCRSDGANAVCGVSAGYSESRILN